MPIQITKNSKTVLCAVNCKFAHTNLAVRSIKAYAKTQNPQLNIEIFETTINDSISNTLARLYELDADLYGFSCYLWNINYILELADSLKKAFSGKKEICVFLGGPEVSFDACDVLNQNPFIDFIVCGEGEYAVYNILNGSLAECEPSVTYRCGNLIKQNKSSGEYVDLNRLPLAYMEDIDTLGNRLVYYESSRGCPFSCAYCLSGCDNKVRAKDISLVKDDFLFFINHNVPLVKLVDRTFNFNKKRTFELVDFIIKNSKNTKFHFEISADILDDEILELIKSSPKELMQFEIGVQSTNIKTLNAIGRHTNFSKISKNVKKLLGYNNVHIHLDLIAGLPYEDLQSFKKSFNDVLNLKPDVLQLGFLKLLKGSKLRDNAHTYGILFSNCAPYEIIKNDYIDYTSLCELKDVEFALDRIYNSGYFKNSLDVLYKHYEYDYYKLFYDISQYFKSRGYLDVSVSKFQLYDVLYEMFKSIGTRFLDAITYDWLLNVTSHARPYWIDFVSDKEFNDKCFDILKNEELKAKIMPEYYNVPAKKIIKTTFFYKFSHKILMFDKQNEKVIDVTEYFD